MAPSITRTWHVAGAVVVSVGAVVSCGPAAPGAGPSAPAAPAAPSPAAAPSGDRRMRDALRAVADRTDAVNSFLGDALTIAARKALAELPVYAPVSQRVNAEVRVGNEELRIGDAQAAIEHLVAAKVLLRGLEATADPNTATEAAYRLGVAYMRLGENENCCARPSSESCIVPIRGAGLHADKRGSRQAVEQFREALRLAKKDSSHWFKSRWLLNIAAMTLGEWPQGLSEEELIPQSAFDSGVVIPRFENVAGQLGVDTTNLAGGAVVDDLDGDGRLDILTSTSDAHLPPRFLHNDGHGGFEDRTREAGLLDELGGLNMVDADYDDDGDLDVYVLRGGWFRGEAGRVPNSLLRNDGAGHFTDVTFDAGLGDTSFPTHSASWGDYDGDGRLDLYVGSETAPDNDFPNRLFHNEGDGTFKDVARKAGVENWRFCKSVVWGDYDGDRLPDIYVSNNGALNRLYRNKGDGTFEDVAEKLGVAKPIASFGAFFFDFDNDGALDLYVTGYRGVTGEVARVAASALGLCVDEGGEARMFYRDDGRPETQRLYRNDGHGGFKDVTAEYGLDRVVVPMGHNFGDLNDDGWLDFYLGTGYPDFESLMPNVMYLNQDGRRFADVSWSGGFGHLQKGHGVAFADIDGDGDTDVFEEVGGSLLGDRFYNALWRSPGFGNHTLTVQLVGRRSNRCAIGARLKADIVEGDRRRSVYRHVNTGGTFGCNPLRQMLGLGKATRVERLEVFWPTTGATQVFTDLAVDRGIRIVEDAEGYEPLGR